MQASASSHTDGTLKNHPIHSVVVLYEESGNLVRFGISPTSIWALLVALSRCDDCWLVSYKLI
jgi:hypothetical protein